MNLNNILTRNIKLLVIIKTIIGILWIALIPANAAIHVDPKTGDDAQKGTLETPVKSVVRAFEILKQEKSEPVIKLHPGVHAVDQVIRIDMLRDQIDDAIVVEASILPGKDGWSPEQMPVLVPGSSVGDLNVAGSDVFTILFSVERNHVEFRGLKFLGSPHPQSRYIPILRSVGDWDDLKVVQCLFVGNWHTPIQVGILADGDGIDIDHCIFYEAKNAVVYWRNFEKDRPKQGNRFTHNIVWGAYQTAIWTAAEDENLVCHNNIVAGGKHFWIRNADNSSDYTAKDSVVVQNKFHQTIWNTEDQPGCFGLKEINMIRKGEIQLVDIVDVDNAMPLDYLHIVPGTLGHELGAGLLE